MQKPTIIAIGYSVRALVEACSRADYQSIAVDHFGDVDTLVCSDGNWIPLELTDSMSLATDTMNALSTIVYEHATSERPLAVLLGGGMENLPLAIAQLETIVQVFGPTAKQLQLLRSIQVWQAAAQAAGLNFPAITNKRNQTEPSHAWLWKPVASAGGLQIGWVPPTKFLTSTANVGYWQQHITGKQIGATCVVYADAIEFIGATQSFSAADWPGPTEFIYRGSIGPTPLAAVQQQRIVKLAEYFREQCGLRGWIQFDFIEDSHGDLWLLECNPRWSAGMEVLILAGSRLIEKHLESADCNFPQSRVLTHACDSGCVAKAVVYATHELEITQSMVDELHVQMQLRSKSFSWLTDVPNHPQRIQQGHPIATVRCQIYDETRTVEVALDALRTSQDRILEVLSAKSCVVR